MDAFSANLEYSVPAACCPSPSFSAAALMAAAAPEVSAAVRKLLASASNDSMRAKPLSVVIFSLRKARNASLVRPPE